MQASPDQLVCEPFDKATKVSWLAVSGVASTRNVNVPVFEANAVFTHCVVPAVAVLQFALLTVPVIAADVVILPALSRARAENV